MHSANAPAPAKIHSWTLYKAGAECANRGFWIYSHVELEQCVIHCNNIHEKFMLWNIQYTKCNCCGNPPKVTHTSAAPTRNQSIYQINRSKFLII